MFDPRRAATTRPAGDPARLYPPVHSPARSPVNLLRKIETTIGALFAFLVGFVLLVFGGDVVYLDYAGHSRYWAVTCAVWVALVLPECVFLFVLKRSLEEGRHPFAPLFAARVRRLPPVLRPAAAAWFAAHFLLAVAATVLFEHLLGGAPHPSDVPRFLAFVALGFTAAWSSNLYALLALAAAGGGDRVLRFAWRWRVALDLAVALAAAGLPFVQGR